ncbi:MAG: tRNA pseudouridine(55) synthase TruB [Clostridia bacterium]|nr:tRNA pseudouridine(55) synthase TruB [Clostridia bacterium]
MDGLSGLLPVIKPPGMTSFAVIRQVKRILKGVRKVGHGGTLDPEASGVLILGLGRATRALEYCLGLHKTYRAEVIFGLTTDTQDLSGRIVKYQPGSKLEAESVVRAAMTLRGEILQVPPMVSAIRYQGRRLYQWAREGAVVPRTARAVVIYRFDVLDFFCSPFHPRAIIEVECSSGTYVRSLADSLGGVLGCGATLGFLVRVRVGNLGLGDCFSLEEVLHLAKAGRLQEALRSPDVFLSNWPVFWVTPEEEARLIQGQKVFLVRPYSQDKLVPEQYCRIYGPDGKLLGIGWVSPNNEQLAVQVRKMLR